MTDLAKLKSVPKSALRFAAGTVSIDKLADGESAEGAEVEDRRFEMLAHSGADMPSMWFGKIAVDLAGVKVNRQDMPALRNHDDDRIVGHTDAIAVDKTEGITAAGVIHDFTADGEEVLKLADNGFPWQASIYIPPTSVEDVGAGVETEVNGRKFTGPGVIFRQSVLREVTFCALGRDENTNAACFKDGGDIVDLSEVQFVGPSHKEKDMDWKDLTIDQLKAERPDLFEEMGATFSANADASVKERTAELAESAATRIAGIFAAGAEFGASLENVKEALLSEDSVEKIEASFARAKMGAIKDGAATPPAGDVPPADPEDAFAGLEGEALWKAQFEKDGAIRAEFGEEKYYLAFMAANDRGVIKLKSELGNIG